jgi:hypothetical protein
MADVSKSIEKALTEFHQMLREQHWAVLTGVVAGGMILLLIPWGPRIPKRQEFWVGSKRFHDFDDASTYALARAMETGRTVDLVLYGPEGVTEHVYIDADVQS